ncbi:hypothetical protein D1872_354450 [compost metagenome]
MHVLPLHLLSQRFLRAEQGLQLFLNVPEFILPAIRLRRRGIQAFGKLQQP